VRETVAPSTVVVNNKCDEEERSKIIRYYERLSNTLKTKVPTNLTSSPRPILNFGISLCSSASFSAFREEDDLNQHSKPQFSGRRAYSGNMTLLVRAT